MVLKTLYIYESVSNFNSLYNKYHNTEIQLIITVTFENNDSKNLPVQLLVTNVPSVKSN